MIRDIEKIEGKVAELAKVLDGQRRGFSLAIIEEIESGLTQLRLKAGGLGLLDRPAPRAVEEVRRELEDARRQHGLQHDVPHFGARDTSDRHWHAIGEQLEETARGVLHRDPSWAGILCEEVGEALRERNPIALRAELLQVAAMAIAWVDKLDAEAAEPGPVTAGGAA